LLPCLIVIAGTAGAGVNAKKIDLNAFDALKKTIALPNERPFDLSRS
jgi:hypothetical protein